MRLIPLIELTEFSKSSVIGFWGEPSVTKLRLIQGKLVGKRQLSSHVHKANSLCCFYSSDFHFFSCCKYKWESGNGIKGTEGSSGLKERGRKEEGSENKWSKVPKRKIDSMVK